MWRLSRCKLMLEAVWKGQKPSLLTHQNKAGVMGTIRFILVPVCSKVGLLSFSV